jgi:hypothetical protein
LGDGDAVFFDRFAVRTVGEEGGGFGEAGDTGDAGIFLVQFARDYFFFGRADGREDVGLALVVA